MIVCTEKDKIGIQEDLICEFIDEPVIEENSSNNANENMCSTETDHINWKSYTPSTLRTPVSNELKTTKTKAQHKDEPLKNKIGSWAKSKIQLTELQREQHVKEHELKMLHLKEKHKKELELMEVESKIRMEFARKEHEARMKKINSDV
ncbi:uncharacterized protein [Diabrotica undecimpunctata]|uniref:uncharacterized protein n=1 Tax=Diabrotica undecimpunctata TaxID=50387 RepID=UPI003B63D51E